MNAKLIDNKRTKAQFFRVKTQNIRQVILGNIAVKTHKKINKMRKINLNKNELQQLFRVVTNKIIESGSDDYFKLQDKLRNALHEIYLEERKGNIISLTMIKEKLNK